MRAHKHTHNSQAPSDTPYAIGEQRERAAKEASANSENWNSEYNNEYCVMAPCAFRAARSRGKKIIYTKQCTQNTKIQDGLTHMVTVPTT